MVQIAFAFFDMLYFTATPAKQREFCGYLKQQIRALDKHLPQL